MVKRRATIRVTVGRKQNKVIPQVVFQVDVHMDVINLSLDGDLPKGAHDVPMGFSPAKAFDSPDLLLNIHHCHRRRQMDQFPRETVKKSGKNQRKMNLLPGFGDFFEGRSQHAVGGYDEVSFWAEAHAHAALRTIPRRPHAPRARPTVHPGIKLNPGSRRFFLRSWLLRGPKSFLTGPSASAVATASRRGLEILFSLSILKPLHQPH